jgi:hypothetical protein
MEIQIEAINTNDQLANQLTKEWPVDTFRAA